MSHQIVPEEDDDEDDEEMQLLTVEEGGDGDAACTGVRSRVGTHACEVLVVNCPLFSSLFRFGQAVPRLIVCLIISSRLYN